MFVNKPLGELEADDLNQLITDKESEGRTLDYKLTLPGKTEDEKKEFLTDVTSFANGSGGYLIYGMSEDKGLPIALVGVDAQDIDAEARRLDQMIRTGIEPRLFAFFLQPVLLTTGKYTLILHVPRSWNRPHAVTSKGTPGSMRFFSRSTNGKYPLDVAELRSAFVGAETEAERIRTFRAERLASIVAGELPVAIPGSRRAIMHLVPVGAFERGTVADLAAAAQFVDLMKTSTDQVYGKRRYNYEGFLTLEPLETHNTADVYLQVYRNGIIEALNAEILNAYDGSDTIPATTYEEEVIAMLPRYLALAERIGVEPPIVLMLSLVGVNNLAIEAPTSPFSVRRPDPIDRDVLMLPDILLDSFQCDVAKVLKPAFDVLWNTAGYARSINYDEQGNRKPTR